MLEADKSKWPAGVRGIAFDELDNFGLDSRMQLH